MGKGEVEQVELTVKKKTRAILVGGVIGVVVIAVGVYLGTTVPVTLSAPPDEAVVYVGSDEEFVPPHDVPLPESFLYEPMTYREAVEAGYEPRDPEAIRVTAPSALEVLRYRLTGKTPELLWAGTGEQPSYLD